MTISVTDTATGQELTVREVHAALGADTPIFDSLAHLPGADNAWRQQAGLSHARFDGMSIRDVEPPSETPPPLEVRPDVPTRVEPDGPPDLIGLGVGPALRGRCGTIGEPSPFDPTPAPDENMPGRVAPTPRGGLQEQAERYARQQALRQAAERGTATGTYHLPALEPTPEGSRREQIVVRRVRRALTEVESELGERSYERAESGIDWRAEWAALKADLARPLRWWLRKQTQRDERMGAEQ